MIYDISNDNGVYTANLNNLCYTFFIPHCVCSLTTTMLLHTHMNINTYQNINGTRTYKNHIYLIKQLPNHISGLSMNFHK